ncbi:MAG: DNA-binding response regulator [Cyanobacteria bacterium PR.3.49]|jgi:DNA-binding response OmpR family regulator|nr:DNA-binding response regulator [Cyanobacteria bacterium PR.3.49]
MAKILVVEDDKQISQFVCDSLAFEHHTVEAAYDGDDGHDMLAVNEYDLVILDRSLPGKDGIEICKAYRARGGSSPVLMLTGMSKIAERAEGLDSGADDYLTKPFHMQELTARVRALLRRRGGKLLDDKLTLGHVSLDTRSFKVTAGGSAVKLVPKEFALLELLMRNRGQVFSADAIINRVWTAEEEASPETIRTYIKNIRKKLESQTHPPIIHTVHGVGYKADLE